MTQVVSAVMGPARLSPYAKLLSAVAMFDRGKGFVGAAALLLNTRQYRPVALHLFCQGAEITLKAFLLMHDYDRHQPRLKKTYGHNLVRLADEVLKAYHPRRVLRDDVAAELKALSDRYRVQELRYAHAAELFTGPPDHPYELAGRKLLAAVKVAERILSRHPDLRAFWSGAAGSEVSAESVEAHDRQGTTGEPEAGRAPVE